DILSLAGPYLGLLLVIVFFSLLIGLTGHRVESFLSRGNMRLVAVQAAIPAAVALGMTVIMISGGIDLSVGYVVSLATVTMMLTYRWADAQPYLPGGASVWAVAAVLGRYCFALGSNEATARLCGVHVERTKVILYTLAGLLTGWGGILQFARSRAGLHDVQAGLELEVIAAVVIGGGSLSGGEGTVMGALGGALMITLRGNGCSKLGLPGVV